MAKLIGTAGHVDHGKTTLIQALTGIDADRLPEEKERGMTIDVGFAYVDLPGVGRVSIVDVPGHEKFLTNMLVGALGIDVALLCVAADESVKPQTREHLQILELLPVDEMVVALTRADLADDDTRGVATLEIEELLKDTRFAKAPIIPVSALKGDGLEDLKAELVKALSKPERAKSGPWYLPIDRAFSVKGHGCVVTGTLAQGEVKVGDQAFLEPGNQEVRVRAIHSHDEEIPSGEAGRRIALNISGVKLEDIHRGQAIGAPGALFESRTFDAQVRWVSKPKHGLRIRVSVGAEEGIGRVFLNDEQPDIAQIRLENDLACALNQSVIIRRYSPPDLLGGGRIVIPVAIARRKSEKANAVLAGNENDAVIQAVGDSVQGVPTDEICRTLGKTPQALGPVFEDLLVQRKILGFAGLWFGEEGFARGSQLFLDALAKVHAANPTIANVPRERVLQTAGLHWRDKPLDRIIAMLAAEEKIESNGTHVRLPEFKVQLTPKQRNFLDRTLGVLTEEPVNTPNPHQLSLLLHAPIQAVEEILKLGVQAGEVVSLGEGVFYTPAQLEAIKGRLKGQYQARPFPASDARDFLGTTRKYIIPLLEYLDTTRFTVRTGDTRAIKG